MPEPVRLVHQIQGRARLRVLSRRGDAAWFAEVEQRLAARPQVRSVVVTPETGSVLLLHEGALADVLCDAALAELLAIEEPPPSAEQVAGSLEEGVAAVDRWLRSLPGGSLDVRSAGFVAFAGLGVLQMLRGQALPAGLTLLHYALEALGHAPKKPPAGD